MGVQGGFNWWQLQGRQEGSVAAHARVRRVGRRARPVKEQGRKGAEAAARPHAFRLLPPTWSRRVLMGSLNCNAHPSLCPKCLCSSTQVCGRLPTSHSHQQDRAGADGLSHLQRPPFREAAAPARAVGPGKVRPSEEEGCMDKLKVQRVILCYCFFKPCGLDSCCCCCCFAATVCSRLLSPGCA